MMKIWVFCAVENKIHLLAKLYKHDLGEVLVKPFPVFLVASCFSVADTSGGCAIFITSKARIKSPSSKKQKNRIFHTLM